MSSDKKEVLHCITTNVIFVSGRLRVDITPTVAVLSGRVRNLNKDAWGKLRRLVKYLNGTKELYLTLRYDGLLIARWHVDASFAIHPDFRSHLGGVLLMDPQGRGMASGNVK